MANQFLRVWLGPAILLLLAAIDDGESKGEEVPKRLSAETAKAWSEAGAEVGWMNDLPPRRSEYDAFWFPWREKEEAKAIPAFRFPLEWPEGVFGKLPAPDRPFGLDFHCGLYAGVSLKELAALKNLQSLNIGGGQESVRMYADLKDLASMTNLRALYLFHLPVTDKQVKHLAGLKNLQVLDLSHTPLTDAGLKELEGLRHLQWLNLHSTQVTSAGVDAIVKKLPGCNLLLGPEQVKGAEPAAAPGHDGE